MEQDSGKKRQRGSEEAKQWALSRTGAIGKAVRDRRTFLDLSALELSNRTKEIGYPITRGTIAKIESNSRSAKLDVNELLTLAAALQIAPADLLFPGYPSAGSEVLPQCYLPSIQASGWFAASGDYRPFGIARAPRSEDSVELRRMSDALADLLERSQQLLGVGADGSVDPELVTREQAQAIYIDAHKIKQEIEKMGGSVGLPAWFSELQELLDDSGTIWLPF